MRQQLGKKVTREIHEFMTVVKRRYPQKWKSAWKIMWNNDIGECMYQSNDEMNAEVANGI